MKKTRLVLMLLTLAAGIYMIYVNISVSGYLLLTMDSAAGYRAAVSYRWSVVVFLLLLAVDFIVALTAKKRRKKKRKTFQ